MVRRVRHFSLHRIASSAAPAGLTELRVVSDVEAGVLPVLQVEEAVIRDYARQEGWPHRWVTLFILQDLQPLVRQLTPTPSPSLLSTYRGEDRVEVGGGSKEGRASLPPGGTTALDQRPVINLYDRTDLDGCHLFVNRQAMVKEGYWDDPLVIRGLLAHEHAHPLAENGTIRASRRLQVDIAPDLGWPLADLETEKRQSAMIRVLGLLADELALYAPREIFANELTIRRGFGEALFHLDRCNLVQARRSLARRPDLVRQLDREVSRGSLTPVAAGQLLLVGDLRGYLALTLEIAPFYRSGQESEARQLEAVLETDIFPHLEPQVAEAYTALREHYLSLPADLSPPALRVWSEGALGILARALADRGLALHGGLHTSDRADRTEAESH